MLVCHAGSVVCPCINYRITRELIIDGGDGERPIENIH